MLMQILNRPTAKAVKRKDNKTSLRSSFVAFIALRYFYLFIRKQVMRAETRGVAILLVLVSA
jgi:hypothetical protein